MEPKTKITSVKFLKGSPLVGATKKISTKSIVEERSVDLGVIKKQVIQINNLIKTGTLLKANEEEQKRKRAEQEKFKQREEQLEEQKEKQDRIPKLPSLPRLGFLDRIKKFLFNIFLGYISLRLLPYLPKLSGVVNTIIKVQDTVIDISGKILNGLVSFVDKAYEVHDKTKKFLGDIGGAPFLKAFDGLTGAIDKLIGASIIAAIAFSELDDDGGGPDTSRKTGRGVASKGLGRTVKRLGLKTIGKDATKNALRLIRPLVRNAPLIGGLLEFGISWALGDPLPKAAFRGVGSILLGAIGTAIGGPIGLAIGGYAGGELAGILYDAFFGNKKSSPTKVQGRAQGGSITRGGKYTGPIKRTVQKSKAKRILKPEKTEVKPGQSVGGKEKIKKIFPEVDTKEKTTTVNPLGYMKDNYKTASSIPGLGGLASLFIKAQLGDRPSNVDYQNAADGLTAWMQRTVGGGIQRTGGAFAGGGEVDVGMFSDDNEMRNVVAKAIQDSVAPKVDDMINDLMKQLGLKGIEGRTEKQDGQPTTPTSGELAEGTIARGQITIDQLIGLAKGAGFSESDAVIMAAIAMAESGGNSNAHNAVPPDNSYGLWQINMIGALGPARLKEIGISNNEQLKDPVINAHAAKLIKQSQGFGAWTVYKSGKYKSYLGAAQKAAGSPAITVYRQPSGGGFMPLGSEQGNLQEAKRIAESMGVPLYSHVRPTSAGYHGVGRAMDFSNDAVGRGTPQQLKLAQTLVQRFGKSAKEIIYTPLGFSIKDGEKVEPIDPSNHYHHVHVAFNKGGKVKGKMGIDQIRAMLTHGEFVLDVNSTTALEDNYPGFLDALNKADYTGALNVLKNYASYEMGATIRAFIDERIVPVPVPVKSMQQPVVAVFSTGESEDHLASSYAG